MIITIAHGAGDCAKSIVADNLATLRTLSGSKLILLDNDARHSSLDWSRARRRTADCTPVTVRRVSGKGMQAELENLGFHYQDIVIDAEARDCMGSRSALQAAHVTILVIDLDQLEQLQEHELGTRMQLAQAENTRMRTLVVMSCSDVQAAADKVARVKDFVSKLDSAELFHYPLFCGGSFHQAYQHGLSVCEYPAAHPMTIKAMHVLSGKVFASH
ncbi:hypothetical protein ACO0LL_26820 [Undibacterium sp. TC4M20W]|uniref:hypothetical protein n=1 Tax=Undibacterium sp. TC4M20W TaxID=3413052 RepID=UPI003BF34DDE